MKDPLVTFLVPAYNAMPLVRETVRSMQAQTLRDFRAVIVDDGSTDGTGEFLDSIGDSRFQIIHQENTGYVTALNRGAAKITTPYFARLDADDLALPTRLEKQVSFLEKHRDVAVVAAATGYIFRRNRRFGLGIGRWSTSPSFAPPMQNPPFWNPSSDGQTITHSAATVRTSAFREVGGYRELAPAEDTDLWLRLHDAGFRLACLPEVLGLYRVGTGSVSSLAYSRQIQILKYSRWCHEARVNREVEMTFEEYARAFPLGEEEVASGKGRLELRNAMGEMLAGHFLKGGISLARILATRPGDLWYKVRTRCGRPPGRGKATEQARTEEG